MLLWAAGENDTPKVQELLAAGADVTVQDLDGRTPLQLATKPEVLDMLRKREAQLAK